MNHLISAYRLIFGVVFLYRSRLAAAQSSSCSTAQSVSVPFTSSEGTVDALLNVNLEDVCKSGGLSDADLQGGEWFFYEPANHRIARIKVVRPNSDDDYPSFEDAPEIAIFGGSCDSLVCIVGDFTKVDALLEVEAGDSYFIFLYNIEDWRGRSYILSVEEVEPPANDETENAIALTSQDLPFSEEFTTYGARSDFSLDACALYGSYGVWFTYTALDVAEVLSLRTTLGNSNFIVGIQVQDPSDGSFACMARGSGGGATLEFVVEANRVYYILVVEVRPDYAVAFDFTLQSLGSVSVSTDSPTLAPVAVTLAPTIAPSLDPTPATVEEEDESEKETDGPTGSTAGPLTTAAPTAAASTTSNDESSATQSTVVVATSIAIGWQLLQLLL